MKPKAFLSLLSNPVRLHFRGYFYAFSHPHPLAGEILEETLVLPMSAVIGHDTWYSTRYLDDQGYPVPLRFNEDSRDDLMYNHLQSIELVTDPRVVASKPVEYRRIKSLRAIARESSEGTAAATADPFEEEDEEITL